MILALSFQQIRDLLSAAISDRFPLQYLWVRDVYMDYCIIADYTSDEMVFYKMAYMSDEVAGTVTLVGEPEQCRMVIEYLPMTEAVSLQEAADTEGWQWRVVMIAPGLSKNNFHYSEEVLRAATPLFEGVRALSRSDADHLENRSKSVENIVGWYKDVEYQEGVGVVGTLHICEDSDWLRLKLRSAFDAGKVDLVQFSIVASGSGKRQLVEGRVITYVESIDHVEFVDTVVDAAAGGRVLQLVASINTQQQREIGMLQTLLKMLEAQRPDLYAKIDVNNVSEEQVAALLTEAVTTPLIRTEPPTVTTPPASGNISPVTPPVITHAAPVIVPLVAAQAAAQTPIVVPTGTDATTLQTITQLLEATRQSHEQLRQLTEASERRIQMSEARAMLTDTLNISTLPAAAVLRVRQRFQSMLDTGTVFTGTQLTEALTAERDYLASLHSSGAITGFGPQVAGQLQIGESQEDKAVTMLDDFFQNKTHSFKECYIMITGDKRVCGLLREATNLGHFRGQFRESLDTTIFDQIFADAMNRQLVREYARLNLGLWRNICDVVPASDFRTRHRIRVGGYANLTTVAQGGIYPALVSPTDEEATYAVVKRGGTEDLTLEMIRNDDVSSIRLIPLRMARAAVQTLHEFVFDFVNGNAAIYDSVALFHSSHANITTTAFSATEYMIHRRKMRSQTELSSSKALGLLPKVLMVPNTLEEAGYNAFRQDTNLAPRLVQTNEIRPMIIVVDYWTDADNWYTASSIDQTPLIELAFLDGNEDPEMLVQDMPEVGSMFTNDKRTYKIRHIYGGAVVDYRGFCGAVV